MLPRAFSRLHCFPLVSHCCSRCLGCVTMRWISAPASVTSPRSFLTQGRVLFASIYTSVSKQKLRKPRRLINWLLMNWSVECTSSSSATASSRFADATMNRVIRRCLSASKALGSSSDLESEPVRFSTTQMRRDRLLTVVRRNGGSLNRPGLGNHLSSCVMIASTASLKYCLFTAKSLKEHILPRSS